MYFWLSNRARAAAMADRFSTIHRVLLAKYYVDEIYDALIVQPIKTLSTGALWKGVDAWFIDGIVNGAGSVTRRVADASRYAQAGLIRGYALVMLGGAVAVLSYLLWLR